MCKWLCYSVSFLLLAGCSLLESGAFDGMPFGAGRAPARSEAPPPAAASAAASAASAARTAEAMDATTEEERVRARQGAAPAAGEVFLGTTIASLGTVSEPGIWLRTPLVSTPGKGRVTYPVKGTSVLVDLIPLEGERGRGSRISLAAMRLLEAALTDLPELRVYRLN